MYKSDELNKRLPYAFGNELAWLRNAAKDANHAVMIGAGPGIMGMALMEGNPDLNLLIIDIQTCRYARAHIDSAGFPLVGYVVSDSSTYDYGGPKLDLLIVDGDHKCSGVIADVHNWFKHVKSGGLIFFHDYEVINDDLTNGVKDAIGLLIKENVLLADEYATPGISWVCRKY